MNTYLVNYYIEYGDDFFDRIKGFQTVVSEFNDAWFDTPQMAGFRSDKSIDEIEGILKSSYFRPETDRIIVFQATVHDVRKHGEDSNPEKLVHAAH